MMRALTLLRPWPWAILHGRKDVENRTWAPPARLIGERIAIHAGLRYDFDGAEFIAMIVDRERCPPFMDRDAAHPTGIVGTVRIARVVEAFGQAGWTFGPFLWVLEDPRALPAPIPCRGAQGLWVVPADVERKVLAALGAAGQGAA